MINTQLRALVVQTWYSNKMPLISRAYIISSNCWYLIGKYVQNIIYFAFNYLYKLDTLSAIRKPENMNAFNRARIPGNSPAQLKRTISKSSQIPLHKILIAQNSTQILIPKASFKCVVRKIEKDLYFEVRFERCAI